MQTSSEIRQQFIDFFVQKHGHTFVPSSPVVPHDDPTLLFTNAGMNQFKDVFLATGSREYTRAVNSQKCIRAGGKHNDLEDVGKDTYHHTFFEMLGNWSFGDYFKEEAIKWAWELLTEVWGLDKSRLHATVFGGDEAEGLAPDEEAADLWRKVTDIDPSHIHYGSKKDNFWEMGETGPCGPCTEIHIDRTPDKSGAALVNGDDARVMEIWNLVFIQFNRDSAGKLSPLPAKHVDTGMGFERICSVLQGKDSNYDTDVFTPIFKAISEITGAAPYTRKLDNAVDMAYRVIGDHIRTLTFALTDGAVPSNEGRGYVLRRILRRAVRHGWQTLGCNEPFLCKLVPAVVDAMSEAFPELKKNPQHVIDLIRDEEEAFERTLGRGIALFDQAAQRGGKEVSAEDAFKLHDTYGFPLDLTQVMAEERGMSVDVAGFNKLMADARELARAGGGAGADARDSLLDVVQKDAPPATTFTGYETTSEEATVQCRLYRLEDSAYRRIAKVTEGETLALVTSSSPFYAEAGGQVGDVGIIESESGAQFEVHDTIKVGQTHFHLGKLIKGELEENENAKLRLSVDKDRRAKIMANHTSTHVMNHKLRAVLGEHVQQKGSLVDDQKLRFDFSHNNAVTTEQIDQVQQMVNADIAANLPVYANVQPQEEALNIHGLRAVFGEKYPPKVRVVSIGQPVETLVAQPDNAQWENYSIEFCGGTHLPSTGAAERFVLVAEEAVAKGVRRVTALTGKLAAQAQAEAKALANQIQQLHNAPADTLAAQVAELTNAVNSATLPLVDKAQLRGELAELSKKVKDLEKARSREAGSAVVDAARKLADEASGPVIVSPIEGADANALRTAMDVMRKKHPQSAIFLGAVTGEKIAFVAAVPEEMVKKGLKAGDWVREVAKVAGGGGGGRPDMAQAGGNDPSQFDAAMAKASEFATAKV